MILDINKYPIERKKLVFENGFWKFKRIGNELIYHIINYQQMPIPMYNNSDKKIVIFIRHGKSTANLSEPN